MYLSAIKTIFKAKGRINRGQYLAVILFLADAILLDALFYMAFYFIDPITEIPIPGIIALFIIFLLIPSTIKRVHDMNFSSWLVLLYLPFFPILLLLPGDAEENKYGAPQIGFKIKNFLTIVGLIFIGLILYVLIEVVGEPKMKQYNSSIRYQPQKTYTIIPLGPSTSQNFPTTSDSIVNNKQEGAKEQLKNASKFIKLMAELHPEIVQEYANIPESFKGDLSDENIIKKMPVLYKKFIEYQMKAPDKEFYDVFYTEYKRLKKYGCSFFIPSQEEAKETAEVKYNLVMAAINNPQKYREVSDAEMERLVRKIIQTHIDRGYSLKNLQLMTSNKTYLLSESERCQAEKNFYDSIVSLPKEEAIAFLRKLSSMYMLNKK